MIEHRKYLLYYGPESWNYGFWEAIFKNPPCKKPGTPKNKQYEYKIELVNGKEKEIYLQLIGDSLELDEIEHQLAKFKIARLEDNNSIIIICNPGIFSNLDMFYKYCQDKNYYISGKIVVPPKQKKL